MSIKKRVFKKLSNVEHVRLRTGMWLGQNSPSVFEQHFFVPNKKGGYDVIHEELQEVPAKLKCIDEACMNAVDEYNRNLIDRKIPVKEKMNVLTVTLNGDRKRIRITDNGRGIPSKNAENVFLHLMYGENFDDQGREEHITGQNGVGISLVRIVSKYFQVETTSGGEYFSKVFTLTDEFIKTCEKLKLSNALFEKIKLYFDEHGTLKGLKDVDAKIISALNTVMKKTGMIATINKNQLRSNHGTQIEFELETSYFSKQDVSFSERWLAQYLQDLAMTNPGLTINLVIDKKHQTFLFKKGLEDVFKNNPESKYLLNYTTKDKQFSLQAVLLGKDGKTLSWVNSNFVSLGGSAIEYLTNRICDEIRKKPAIISHERKLKVQATRNDVRECFHMYNNFQLIDPRFKSQDKSYLINDLKETIRELVDKYLDRIIKNLDLVNSIKEVMERRVKIKELDSATKDLRRTSTQSIPKFIPCTSRSHNTVKTLFIGEGDSAIAGLRPVRDPAVHGLFPLRGKPLNVKGMSLSKSLANEELKNIVSILQLPFSSSNIGSTKVGSTKINSHTLTFQRIAIMTDADYDGYAIRSLILSFFFEYWPELFNLKMIYMVEAPLYEVELMNPDNKKKIFYCIDDNEYQVLIKKAKKTNCKMLRKKRNKGLGETSREGMAYAIENGLICITAEDYKKSQKIQDIWFNKNNAHARRKEISQYAQLFFDE